MAQYEEFTIDQGADVAIEIHVVDAQNAAKSLSNYAVAAKMKKTYNSDDSQAFNAVVASPATDGVVTLSLTNQQTNALKPGRYVYDVEISFNDSAGATIVERILEGKISVTPSVTK